MADNPFDPKHFGILAALRDDRPRNSLADYVTPLTPQPEVSPLARAIVDGLVEKPAVATGLFGSAVNDLFPKPVLPTNSYPYTSALGNLFGGDPDLSGAAADLFPPSRSFGSLVDLVAPVNPLFAPSAKPKPATPAVKRKAFFSFHYDDIMRVNVIRNAWKINHPDNSLMRSFQDSSLWESRKLEGDEAIKRLIREGVEYTSAVCVLIGTDTWLRRWVRYEIARAIVDGRGLLGVHLNSIRHHQIKTPHTRGYNPFDFMAVGKIQPGLLSIPRYYLFEKKAAPNGVGGYKLEWHEYGDYTLSVPLPSWLADPAPGYVTPLSLNVRVYDYIADHAHQNIGAWIDEAARSVGR
jgi:MTH538 TIR-like domain (DUF1863)